MQDESGEIKVCPEYRAFFGERVSSQRTRHMRRNGNAFSGTARVRGCLEARKPDPRCFVVSSLKSCPVDFPAFLYFSLSRDGISRSHSCESHKSLYDWLESRTEFDYLERSARVIGAAETMTRTIGTTSDRIDNQIESQCLSS